MQNYIADSLNEYLETAIRSANTGSIAWFDRPDVYISFEKGKIIAAQFGTEVGVRALGQWLSLPRYHFIWREQTSARNIGSFDALETEVKNCKRHRQLQTAMLNSLWQEESCKSIIMLEQTMVVNCDPEHQITQYDPVNYAGMYQWLESMKNDDLRLLGGGLELIEFTTGKGNTYLIKDIEGSWIIIEPKNGNEKSIKKSLSEKVGVWQ
jgi:hypothetical protein